MLQAASALRYNHPVLKKLQDEYSLKYGLLDHTYLHCNRSVTEVFLWISEIYELQPHPLYPTLEDNSPIASEAEDEDDSSEPKGKERAKVADDARVTKRAQKKLVREL